MSPKNVSTNTTAVVAIGAAAALTAGAVAYYQTSSKTKNDIEKYNARVRELAMLRTGINPDSPASEASIDNATREFRTNMAAQLRCYLGIKMPGWRKIPQRKVYGFRRKSCQNHVLSSKFPSKINFFFQFEIQKFRFR